MQCCLVCTMNLLALGVAGVKYNEQTYICHKCDPPPTPEELPFAEAEMIVEDTTIEIPIEELLIDVPIIDAKKLAIQRIIFL